MACHDHAHQALARALGLRWHHACSMPRFNACIDHDGVLTPVLERMTRLVVAWATDARVRTRPTAPASLLALLASTTATCAALRQKELHKATANQRATNQLPCVRATNHGHAQPRSGCMAMVVAASLSRLTHAVLACSSATASASVDAGEVRQTQRFPKCLFQFLQLSLCYLLRRI